MVRDWGAALRGIFQIPIPIYLIQKIEERLQGDPQTNPAAFIIEVLSQVLDEDEDLSLPVAEKANIEARLKALGYLRK